MPAPMPPLRYQGGAVRDSRWWPAIARRSLQVCSVSFKVSRELPRTALFESAVLVSLSIG